MSYMFTRHTEQEAPPETPEVEVRKSRIAKFAKFATQKVIGAAESIKNTSVDAYYRGAYHTGQATEFARGVLGKAIHGKQAYLQGVDYGHRYYEPTDHYVSRMEKRGKYAQAAIAVAGLAAVVIASRLGSFEDGVDSVLASNQSELPTLSPDVAQESIWDSVDDSIVVVPDVSPTQLPSLSETVIATELTKQARTVIDTALDGQTVAQGDSLWSMIEDTLAKNGVAEPTNEQINLLKNDFMQRHSAQLDANGWLNEGQVLDTI